MDDGGIAYHYVDEAGDLTLFGRRGKCLLGTEGVSLCFMVGVARIAAAREFRERLNELRHDLLADPYLQNIPSMRPGVSKTVRGFHAKDDCPEVRQAVFRLLVKWDIKVQVGVRRKDSLAKEARLARSKGILWQANSVYDNMVKTLFKPSLHKADRNVIAFARRGKSAREKALAEAIERAKANFERDTGMPSDRPTRILPSVPSESCGLQAIDYFLWALQRLYERGEDRYFNYLAPHYRLIMDFDDKRSGRTYGEWYSDQNPLRRGKIMPVTG